MIKVKMKYPQFGGIGRVGDAYVKYLPEFGVRLVNKDPDLRVSHAGAFGANTDIEMNHGVWWTSDMPQVLNNHWTGNARIFDALRAAKIVTVPSNWVRINIARNMHISPRVIPHGIEWAEWQQRYPTQNYVLWNKARDKDVCDPKPVALLARMNRDQHFVTTFCKERATNIKVTGRLPFDKMKPLIQQANVYLATTKETFGIGTLEAMACGVPILGYDWGGTSDLITHKETGYLARPGDINDLSAGLAYCLKHRKRLGGAAREVARGYTWQRAVEMVADVYREALSSTEKPGVTVVIPSYNYSKVVGRAIQSCLAQTHSPKRIIVVDDGSPDQGATKKVVQKFEDKRVRYVRQPNAGVAHARNYGVSLADTELICCLDADDAIAPRYLEALVPAFSDPLLGVAYTGLLLISPDGAHTKQSGWPPDCNFNQQIKGKNQVPTCCVFRRRAWKESGGYRQRYAPQGCGTEDAALWLSLGANGWKMRRVTNEPLFRYTLGGRTWNKKEYHKTDWTGWHPFTKDGIHPFASIAAPNPHASHPVTQLDIPEVSVVIPVGPGHTSILTDALDSLEAQTFRKWEAIVVNDSGEELDLTPWPYVTLVETPGKKGAGYARNRGTEAAKAPEIVYLDADDFLQANALERFLAARAQYPNTWIYPDMYTHRASGEVEYYGCSDFTARELWRRGIGPVTCLYTKKMWKKVKGFDEKSHREDWDFHLRLARAGFCGIRIPEALLTYRHKTGSRRASGSIRKEAEVLHRKYDREELMRKCGGCGKRAKMASAPSNLPPKNWDTKEGAGWKLVEFVGGNQTSMLWKGKSGRKYIAGNNDAHRTIRIHPQDYEMMLRLRYFRPIEEADTVLKAESEPRKPPPAKPKPKKVEDFNITGMTLKQIREADLRGQNLNKLIKMEEENKSRSTVLRELRAEKRRRQRRRNG